MSAFYFSMSYICIFRHFPQDKGFTPESYDIEFRSLQYALFATCFFQAFGAAFFLIVSFYVLDDKKEAGRFDF